MTAPRRILHIDLDAFYVSVERLHDPSLFEVDLLIVGGDPDGRGVVTSASYPARKFGVHSAMPSSRARQLCPGARFIRPSFDRYREASQKVMGVLHDIAPVVQPGGLDEAYLDMTGTERLLHPDLSEVAKRVQTRVKEETSLDSSVGGGTNRFVAKMATNRAKPRGVHIVPPGQEAAFLAPHPVGEMHGIGPASVARLSRLGIRTAAELAAADPERLAATFGLRAALSLIRRAKGIDRSPVHPPEGPKSIGKETTFAEDLSDQREIRRRLLALTETAATKLRRKGLHARTVTVKLRTADWTTRTRSVTVDRPLRTDREIGEVVLGLLDGLLRSGARIRLVGMSLSGLEETVQAELFAPTENRKDVTDLVDGLRERFGAEAIRWAGGMTAPRDRSEKPDA